MDYKVTTLTRDLPNADGTVTTYAVFPKTITDMVFDSDNVCLTDILKKLVTSQELIPIKDQLETMTNVYRLRGILLTDPDKTAMEKLLEHVGMEVGDIYLVQADINTEEGATIFEEYLYSGADYGWMFLGTTNKAGGESKNDHSHPNKAVLDKIPAILGEPNTVLMVSEDGTTLSFNEITGDIFDVVIQEHNTDTTAHPDIRELIDSKADIPNGFNDTLYMANWQLSLTGNTYVYYYTNDAIKSQKYFQILPIEDDAGEVRKAVLSATISSSFLINEDDVGYYGLLTAKKKPTIDIPIFVISYSDLQDI